MDRRSRGGGVLLAVRDYLSSKKVLSSPDNPSKLKQSLLTLSHIPTP